MVSAPSRKHLGLSLWFPELGLPKDQIFGSKAVFERKEKKQYVKVVSYSHHRSITTRALAFDFYDGEFTVFGRLAWFFEIEMA